MAQYDFQSMTKAHLPLLRGWLTKPHVSEWWGDPRDQFELISDDLEYAEMDQFIVATADRPFAYLQCYDPAIWSEGGLGKHPDGTRGIDQFIGEPHMVGRGHGSAFIRQFIESLLASGTPRVVTDPDPDNVRAIRAYEKAGFARDKLVETPDGTSLLMVRDA